MNSQFLYQVSKCIEFPTDWVEKTTEVMKGSLYIRKTDFAMQLCAFVEAGTSTGYLGNVTRELDGRT